MQYKDKLLPILNICPHTPKKNMGPHTPKTNTVYKIHGQTVKELLLIYLLFLSFDFILSCFDCSIAGFYRTNNSFKYSFGFVVVFFRD